MRPEYEFIEGQLQRSFVSKYVIRDRRPLLTQAWHFHPEIEICFTYKSHGKRYVGNNISSYMPGDLVMIGSQLPHGFTTNERSEQVVIQFNNDFLGHSFLNKPELRKVQELIQDAKRGIYFDTEKDQNLRHQIDKIMTSNGFQQLIELLALLHLLSQNLHRVPICSSSYSANLNIKQLSRIKTVFNYIEENYKDPSIDLQHAAEKINLTESAFYKFIKKHTKKKFTHIVNEYRVSHATKLLMESELTVAQIGYQCGFNNLSYFNRKFKEIMTVTPSVFRKKYNR